MQTRRWHGAAIATLAILTGCTSSDGGAALSGTSAAAPDITADQYGYDLDTATLTPVYALIPEYNDPRDGYARDLLARECLTGIVDYQPVILGETDPILDQRAHQAKFDETIAARYGYSALRLHPVSDGAVADHVTITEDLSAQLQACGARTDERLGNPPARLPATIESAGWQAVDTDPAVARAASAWKQCMQPAGVIDLPERPSDMPSASITAGHGGTEAADGTVTEPSSTGPTQREIDIATLDVTCRTTHDWDAVILRARAIAELTAIGNDPESFDATIDAYKAYDAKISAVIAELG